MNAYPSHCQINYSFMKTPWALLFAVFFIWASPLRAQSLDDLLGVGKSELGESRPETRKLWNDLVTALEQGNFESGKNTAQQFLDVIDYTEPYQKNFAAMALKLLNADLEQTGPGTTSAAIAEIQAQITAKATELKALQDKKVELQKNAKDANMSGAVIGALFGGAVDQICEC